MKIILLIYAIIIALLLLINTHWSALIASRPIVARKQESSLYQSRGERRSPYKALQSFARRLSSRRMYTFSSVSI
jgi:hypothetical protein